jgi:hypothetical protein
MFVSTPYSLEPAATLLLTRLLGCLAMTHGLRKSHYMENVIPGKSTAQIRNTDGSFPERASGLEIAVLHLGAKCDHPFGFLAP